MFSFGSGNRNSSTFQAEPLPQIASWWSKQSGRTRERFGREVRSVKSQLSCAESAGRLVGKVLITQRRLKSTQKGGTTRQPCRGRTPPLSYPRPTDRAYQKRTKYRRIYRYFPLLTLSNFFRVNSRWVDRDRVKVAL